MDTFAGLGIGFCNIDQPIFHRSVGPTAHTTSAVGYVRLHGRNYESWFSPHADVRERYDFLYSMDQLEPWVARVRRIAQNAKETYVVTNNHNLNKSTVNALELQAFLSAGPVNGPPRLQLESYPELRPIAAVPKNRRSGRLNAPGALAVLFAPFTSPLNERRSVAVRASCAARDARFEKTNARMLKTTPATEATFPQFPARKSIMRQSQIMTRTDAMRHCYRPCLSSRDPFPISH